MARIKEGVKDKKAIGNRPTSVNEKRKYIKSWPDEKVLKVWKGLKEGEYELGEEDVEILKKELKRRKLSSSVEHIGNEEAVLSEAEVIRTGHDQDDPGDDEEAEQVPVGYIKIYPETPERNEFYRKRYANAKKAWPDTEITKKGEEWYIVTKSGSGSGYDVHLFFTGNRTNVHGTCTCADFSQRGIRRDFPCKHIFMVLVYSGLTEKWPDVD